METKNINSNTIQGTKITKQDINKENLKPLPNNILLHPLKLSDSDTNTISNIASGKAEQLVNIFDTTKPANTPKAKEEKPAPSLAEVKNGVLMKKGETGESVKQIQQRLTALGFSVKATGFFGPMTETALKEFQKANNLQANGILGKTTLEAIEKTEKNPYDPVMGKKLAKASANIATIRNELHKCYNAVAQAVEGIYGTFLTGLSAYEAADQFAKAPKFKEIKVKPENLPKLQAGAIVVWGYTSVSPHGHISIALGDGREASDHIEPQRTELRGYTNCRVFVPAKKK